jgi:Icc-related predicted phosphoesterase
MGRSASDLIFVEPASLLRQLERYRTSDVEEGSFLGGEEEGSAAAIGRRTTAMTGRSSTTTSGGDRRADGKTATMTSFRDSTIAMEQHAKFQARFQNVGSDAAGGANKGSMIVSEVINDDEDVDEGESDVVDDDSDEDDVVDNYDREEEDEDEDGFQSTNDSGAAALAAQLKTEQIRRHLLLSDAYYLARPSKNVRGRRAHTTVAAVHAKYKDRNISKTQQRKLYARRFGNGRREDMALAATRRKEDAARFQSILDRASGIDRIHGGGADHGSLGRNGPHAPSTTLLRMLLRKFDVETAVQSSGTLVENSYVDRTARSFSPNDGVDQLSSTLRVPLRGDTAQNDIDLPPLRIVIISDTHGFEGALSRFVERPDGAGPSNESRNPVVHCDDFLLPKADVLLHCGDFAASGSKKTQRAAARRLDDFLARQTHIPEKIVVQGNHDPDSPAKVLFPNSKALYVRSSSTLSVNGVSFALQPYSRRMAFRSIRKGLSSSVPSLSECDILVSHEPPKGILDMTYHGFSAGSAYLRELVEHAEHKPRLWCCGHIHESRGVITKNFHPVHRHVDDKVDASTMVINASNANSGKANRIVSGAIVVEIERRPSDTLSEQSAENTLRSWRIDHADIFSDSADRSDGLAKLGNDLELYTTRPGVRRRKGVSQSTRQQMKNVSNIKVSK